MQAWQAVIVTNDESAFHGRAGFVLRVEAETKGTVVQVRLDDTEAAPATVAGFDPVELELL